MAFKLLTIVLKCIFKGSPNWSLEYFYARLWNHVESFFDTVQLEQQQEKEVW